MNFFLLLNYGNHIPIIIVDQNLNYFLKLATKLLLRGPRARSFYWSHYDSYLSNLHMQQGSVLVCIRVGWIRKNTKPYPACFCVTHYGHRKRQTSGPLALWVVQQQLDAVIKFIKSRRWSNCSQWYVWRHLQNVHKNLQNMALLKFSFQICRMQMKFLNI